MGPGNGAGFPMWVMMEVLGSLGWVPPVGAPGAEGVGEAGGTHGTLSVPIISIIQGQVLSYKVGGAVWGL